MHYTTKQLALVLCVVLMSFSVRAQVPRTFSYQGLITNNGQPASGSHQIQVRLYDAQSGGTPLLSEPQLALLDASGLFNILIGSKERIPDTLRFNRPYYLGVSIDGVAEGT